MGTLADVVVVGLGATGCAATYQLAKRGVDVVGIDRFSPPHRWGSTHGETRITQRLTMEGAEYVPIVVRSNQLWTEIEKASSERIAAATAHLYIADMTLDEGAFAGQEQLGDALGTHYELLDSGELTDRFPQFAVSKSHAALLEPESGVLFPEVAVRAQLALARRHGATIRLDERVTGIESTASGVVIRTDKGRIAADQAVVAAGPWVTDFLAGTRFDALFTVHRQVMRWFKLTGPPDVFRLGRMPAFFWQLGATVRPRFYGLPSLDGSSLKIASGAHVSTLSGRLGKFSADRESALFYQQYVSGRLPAVSSAIARLETCLVTMTPDRKFVIDRLPGQDRILLASPCSGHGFKHSAAVGESIAELLTVGTSVLDLTPFGLARF